MNIEHLRRGRAIDGQGNSLPIMPLIPTARFLWPAEEGKCEMREGPSPGSPATDAEVN
jgi:hypothetical protein